MTKRSALTRLIGLVLFTVVLLGFTLVQGYRPFLGLDLQGGVSVVLQAKAPDRAEGLARISDALTASSESLGLGEVTVVVDGDTVKVTPAGSVTGEQLDNAQAAAEQIVGDLGLGGTSVSVDGGVLVVRIESDEVSEDSIDQAIEIIRNRVDALGVAEPEITRQGKNVVVQIPGVEDPDAALELVGQTAELRFRPVLADLPPEGAEIPQPETTTTAPGGETTTTVAGDPAATTPESSPDDAVVEDPSTTVDGGGGRSRRTQDDPTDTTVAPDATTPDTATPDTATTDPSVTGDPTDTSVPELTEQDLADLGLDQTTLQNPPTTPPDQDLADATVVLPDAELPVRYQLGTTLVTGSALSGATARVNQQGQWEVVVTFRSGPDGIDAFNAAAAQCSPPSATCPTGRLAIVLDHEVISSPTINEPNFDGSAVISGDFTEQEARDLALVLRYGALPVELEAQTTVRVSATLGADALDAALVSAAVALVAVTLYMAFFYRILGGLAVLKLVIEGSLLWALISYLGETQGLALTLAGITGIIVSIGVSLDSNIVYYEHLKEDVLAGRTLRSTTDRSFASAYSTIVKADVASLIGAGLLWWLTVGPVRGFAFYLGVATLLDLIAAWFYMHPVVNLVTRSDLAQRRPALFGMPHAPVVEGRPGTGRASAKRAGSARAAAGAGGTPDLSKPEASS